MKQAPLRGLRWRPRDSTGTPSGTKGARRDIVAPRTFPRDPARIPSWCASIRRLATPSVQPDTARPGCGIHHTPVDGPRSVCTIGPCPSTRTPSPEAVGSAPTSPTRGCARRRPACRSTRSTPRSRCRPTPCATTARLTRWRSVFPLLDDVLGQAARDCDAVMAVSDAAGQLLWVCGTPSVLRRAESIGFVEGSNWDERLAGTNAPGMALRLDQSVHVIGAEHFRRSVQRWSCAATPIHDPADQSRPRRPRHHRRRRRSSCRRRWRWSGPPPGWPSPSWPASCSSAARRSPRRRPASGARARRCSRPSAATTRC